MKEKQTYKKKIFKNAAGFSFIEVIIAVAIFSVGILAVSALITRSLTNTTTATKMTGSGTLAMDKVEQLMALPYDDITSGEESGIDGQYRIKWTVTPDSPISNVKTVEIEVSQTAGMNRRTISLVYFKMDS